MKLKFALFSLIGLLILAACGEKKKSGGGGDANAQGVDQETVATFRYYKGGFYPAPNQPNWSNDMTIYFGRTGFRIEGRHPDPLCTRGDYYSEAQATELFRLVSELRVTPKTTAPTTDDAGIEYIEITLENGVVHKYHLMDAEVPVGELYALNPAALHDHLQDLEANLPTACQ